MEYLSTLYRYEIKKITGKKIFWITLFLSLLVVAAIPLLPLTGKSYVDGEVTDTHYHMFRVDQAHERALSGRAIDQALLSETVSAYEKIPDPEGRYTLTEEYQVCARPYAAVFQLISRWFDQPFLKDILALEVTEKSFYEARLAFLEEEWQGQFLTEQEKAFWLQKEAEISTPYLYYYHEGYTMLLKSFNTLCVLIPLFAAICLPGVFAEEHTRRTDQLILSGAKGRTTVYLAKISAGVTISLASCALMVLASAILALGIYGTDGFTMQLQATPYPFSHPLTIGAACLIMCGISLILSVFIGIFVMVLSECLHSGIAAMSVTVALILIALLCKVPAQHRVLSQLFCWLPFSFLNIRNVFDLRTLPVFGHCLLSWQIVPVLYLLSCALLAAAGRRVYQRYQVTGR